MGGEIVKKTSIIFQLPLGYLGNHNAKFLNYKLIILVRLAWWYSRDLWILERTRIEGTIETERGNFIDESVGPPLLGFHFYDRYLGIIDCSGTIRSREKGRLCRISAGWYSGSSPDCSFANVFIVHFFGRRILHSHRKVMGTLEGPSGLESKTKGPSNHRWGFETR